ncbi:MAG: ABC transporter ATP-binding protein [Spirochaetales bacterium]|nr:ABC transporter ATP-binding protein [Spirochaetales bacterium]
MQIKYGDFFTIIGSSGAGKSLMAHAILGILPENAEMKGRIIYKGKELTNQSVRKLRGKEIVLVPQSVSFLNPLKTAGWHICRSALLTGISKKEAEYKADKALDYFGLEFRVKGLYPFELSGGMARRILAAAAYVTEADLFIADEPTTGLDADMVEESLDLLKKFTKAKKTVILITHDLKAALRVADTIAVFYGGTIVEITRSRCFTDESLLRHPYSRALFRALPENSFSPLPGANPFGKSIPEGCIFESRCSIKKPECEIKKPENIVYKEGVVRCLYA